MSCFSGCASTPAAGAGPVAPAKTTTAVQANPLDALKKGMTAQQVRACVGVPDQINPFKSGELPSEVWVYSRVISEEARPMAVGTREVPSFNPMTGVSGTVTEQVIGNEFIKYSEITELLMIDGRLIEWKRKPRVERAFQ